MEHARLIEFVDETRKHLRSLGLLLLAGSLASYFAAPRLIITLQSQLDQKLAFFTIAEPFLAHAKMAFLATLAVLMPLILYRLWQALARPFGLSPATWRAFAIATSLLFYTGATFCYLITLPFGIKFLLGFQSEQLQPVISIGRFITFVTVFVLAFGVIFELPVFMVFSAKVGLIPRAGFERHRRYAILAISIVAALLTPTPDVVNMLLMGGPLYLLYEAGIIVLKLLRIP